MKQCLIFDIDGTLANLDHRKHFLDKKDWKGFFAACSQDSVYEDVAHIQKSLLTPFKSMFIVSGRPDSIRKETEEWLANNCISYDRLLMRKEGDYREDSVVKREILNQLRAEGYEITAVFDDRQRVVDMWRSEGVRCFQVCAGDFNDGYEYADESRVIMLIGPSGAGKTTLVEDAYPQHTVLSSDRFREEITGDFQNQSRNDQVFSAMRDILKARTKNGLVTVIDSTNIKNKDRLSFVDCVPSSTPITYLVVDRPLEDKLATAGWRKDVVVKGKTLIEYHHEVFHNNLKAILAGDNRPNLRVVDIRTYGK